METNDRSAPTPPARDEAAPASGGALFPGIEEMDGPIPTRPTGAFEGLKDLDLDDPPPAAAEAAGEEPAGPSYADLEDELARSLLPVSYGHAESLAAAPAPARPAAPDRPPAPAAPAPAAPAPAAPVPGPAPASNGGPVAASPPVKAEQPPLRVGVNDGPSPLTPEQGLTELLEMVVSQQASDLHLVAGTPPLLRVNGDLAAVDGYAALSPVTVEGMINSILSEEQRERLARELELDCAHSLPGSRFRVNVHWQRGSMAAAFRLIPFHIQSPEALGLPVVVRDLARLRRGLVVVTGPTGSGKSTTLASMLDIVNSERRCHILTVEDPIEFLHRHKTSAVSQREVGSDTHGFAQALKHALRQDPDVILVGEMRDLETIATAITAAETGHLVFATLHTQDAPQAIDRIIDVFPAHQQQQVRVQLAITLQGVVAQQLIPTAEGSARAAACEVLVVTPAVRNLIREGKTHQIYSAMQSGRKYGMVTMDGHLAALASEGRITKEIAFHYAHNPDELSRLMGAGYAGGMPTVTG